MRNLREDFAGTPRPNTEKPHAWTPSRPAASARWLPYGDPMRIAGAVAVVVYHVAGYGQGRRSEVGAGGWWVCTLAVCATLWCVPIFILLSGALLLDPQRNKSAASFYRRRLWRIGIPFLFWSGILPSFWQTRDGAQADRVGRDSRSAQGHAGLPPALPHGPRRPLSLHPMFRVLVHHGGAGLIALAAGGALIFATADEAAGSVIGTGAVSSPSPSLSRSSATISPATGSGNAA